MWRNSLNVGQFLRLVLGLSFRGPVDPTLEADGAIEQIDSVISQEE
jgi:hypothetical protein